MLMMKMTLHWIRIPTCILQNEAKNNERGKETKCIVK